MKFLGLCPENVVLTFMKKKIYFRYPSKLLFSTFTVNPKMVQSGLMAQPQGVRLREQKNYLQAISLNVYEKHELLSLIFKYNFTFN